MVTPPPSFIGYTPAEATAAAAELGLRIAWVDAAPPRWLPPRHEARVGRERLREDGTVELLRVLIPVVDDLE